MQNYLTAINLEQARYYQEYLIRKGNKETWIETLVKGKEYRIHPVADKDVRQTAR